MAGPPATPPGVGGAAKLHPPTAPRALSPETRILVSEETARRVAEAAAALGYRPNPVARSLRTRRSHTVGVLIPDLNNPLFPPIVRGLEDKLAAAGYVALIGNTDADAGRERTLFEQMRARHVDGFVLATATLHDRLLAEAAAAGGPVGLMNRTGPGDHLPAWRRTTASPRSRSPTSRARGWRSATWRGSATPGSPTSRARRRHRPD